MKNIIIKTILAVVALCFAVPLAIGAYAFVRLMIDRILHTEPPEQTVLACAASIMLGLVLYCAAGIIDVFMSEKK